MKYLHLACLALLLIAATACAKKDKANAPTAEPTKTEQAAPAPAPAPAPAAASGSTLTPAQLHTCFITNLEDKKCSEGLAKEFSALLIAQGESDKIAVEAGKDFANAFKTVPVDKRNGVRMKSPATGKPYTFLIQNQGGKCFLQLVDKREDSDNFNLLGSSPIPACNCKK